MRGGRGEEVPAAGADVDQPPTRRGEPAEVGQDGLVAAAEAVIRCGRTGG
ncbi:MAG TPA: hypothetical protein VF109_05800 [Mycobacteriales bacterium]